MTIQSRFFLAGALALAAAGCSSKKEGPATSPAAATSATAKRYPMHGKVVSVNVPDKSAKIDAAEITGWMSAMIMDYPVKEAADLSKLTADKTIDATVFVDGDNFWIGEIKEAAPTSVADQKK